MAAELCAARARSSGGLCRHEAGWGTDHQGAGRCKLHGGSSLVKHGRYSTVRREPLKRLIEKHEADPDPLNLLPELALLRALLEDFIERHETFRQALVNWNATRNGTERPARILEIDDAESLLDATGRMVARVEKIRAVNAVSQPELYRIMAEMSRVVAEHVDDELTRAAIRAGWLAIQVQANRANR